MMIKKHDHRRNKKTREYNVKDPVTVKIPRIDHGGVDFPRLPGIVCKISDHGEKFYQILTESGILNDNYRASDLEPFSGLVNVELEDIDTYKKISLKEAAQLQSAKTGSLINVKAVCNCQGICKSDGRCKCWKAGQPCTSHCHLKLPKGVKKKCKYC